MTLGSNTGVIQEARHEGGPTKDVVLPRGRTHNSASGHRHLVHSSEDYETHRTDNFVEKKMVRPQKEVVQVL